MVAGGAQAQRQPVVRAAERLFRSLNAGFRGLRIRRKGLRGGSIRAESAQAPSGQGKNCQADEQPWIS